jgi:hypothetical protein
MQSLCTYRGCGGEQGSKDVWVKVHQQHLEDQVSQRTAQKTALLMQASWFCLTSKSVNYSTCEFKDNRHKVVGVCVLLRHLNACTLY